jgi:hypothetical protein
VISISIISIVIYFFDNSIEIDLMFFFIDECCYDIDVFLFVGNWVFIGFEGLAVYLLLLLVGIDCLVLVSVGIC